MAYIFFLGILVGVAFSFNEKLESWHELRNKQVKYHKAPLSDPGSRLFGCSLDGDVHIIHSQEFINHYGWCSARSFNYLTSPLVRERVSTCLVDVEYPSNRHLTQSCANCYAQYKSCEDTKCAAECIEGICSPRCHACRQHFCNEGLVSCTKLKLPPTRCFNINSVYTSATKGVSLSSIGYLMDRREELLQNDQDIIKAHAFWGCSKASDMHVIYSPNFYRTVDFCTFESSRKLGGRRMVQIKKNNNEIKIGGTQVTEKMTVIQECFARSLSLPCANCFTLWAMCISMQCHLECTLPCNKATHPGFCPTQATTLSDADNNDQNGFARPACALCVEREALKGKCLESIRSCAWLRDPPIHTNAFFNVNELITALMNLYEVHENEIKTYGVIASPLKKMENHITNAQQYIEWTRAKVSNTDIVKEKELSQDAVQWYFNEKNMWLDVVNTLTKGDEDTLSKERVKKTHEYLGNEDSGDAFLFNMRPRFTSLADSSIEGIYQDVAWVSLREYVQWLSLAASLLAGIIMASLSCCFKSRTQRQKKNKTTDKQ